MNVFWKHSFSIFILIFSDASDSTTLFETVLPSLEKGVGSEAVEWKRAYGRSTKHVHLHPKFVQFSGTYPLPSTTEENTPTVPSGPFDESSEAAKALPPLQPADSKGNHEQVLLLDLPMLHIYWTDCSVNSLSFKPLIYVSCYFDLLLTTFKDPEVYRSTIKESIQAWLTSVRSSQAVKEWLIVVVESSDGSKKANKLLPSRSSSVLDKIKNDFAQKQTERVTCLSDPTRMDSKLAESLHALLHRVRQLLLASYSKVLTRFEENMRAQREKRIEPGWNYCRYFLVQVLNDIFNNEIKLCSLKPLQTFYF